MKRTTIKNGGISTLVAVVLILAVVVTLVGIVAAWATGYLEMILGRAGVMISVENVEFIEPGKDRLVVTIMNKGISDTEVKEVYIDGRATTWYMEVGGLETTTIKPDQLGRIFVSFGWESDTHYTIKIATSGYFELIERVISPE